MSVSSTEVHCEKRWKQKRMSLSSLGSSTFVGRKFWMHWWFFSSRGWQKRNMSPPLLKPMVSGTQGSLCSWTWWQSHKHPAMGCLEHDGWGPAGAGCNWALFLSASHHLLLAKQLSYKGLAPLPLKCSCVRLLSCNQWKENIWCFSSWKVSFHRCNEVI